MSNLMDRIFFYKYKYEMTLSDRYVPVVIPRSKYRSATFLLAPFLDPSSRAS
jgi:hypothetical protein